MLCSGKGEVALIQEFSFKILFAKSSLSFHGKEFGRLERSKKESKHLYEIIDGLTKSTVVEYYKENSK